LGLIGLGLGMLVAWTLIRMAGDSDRAARRTHRKLDPFAEITTTRPHS
jgi:hypothetical protein